MHRSRLAGVVIDSLQGDIDESDNIPVGAEDVNAWNDEG